MRLFLGVDGGQSSTTALIGDENGRALGVGVGGPCNHVRAAEEGRAKFTRAMNEAIGKALEQAGIEGGLERTRFEGACLGLSGGPADKEEILREILHTERLILTIDAVIALSGATAGAPGVITIGGTGSIAFGRNAAGQTMRAGGWGYVFGDEGGAFDIVRQALRAILRHEEGWGPATSLREPLLAAGGAKSANDLLHRFYTADFPRSRVATFARIVDEAANKSDPVAQGILRKAASDLSLLMSAVRRKLFREGDAVRLAYIGGVFHSALLLEQFRSLAGQEVAPPLYGPAAGALIEAYRSAGLSPALSGLPEFKS